MTLIAWYYTSWCQDGGIGTREGCNPSESPEPKHSQHIQKLFVTFCLDKLIGDLIAVRLGAEGTKPYPLIDSARIFFLSSRSTARLCASHVSSVGAGQVYSLACLSPLLRLEQLRVTFSETHKGRKAPSLLRFEDRLACSISAYRSRNRPYNFQLLSGRLVADYQ